MYSGDIKLSNFKKISKRTVIAQWWTSLIPLVRSGAMSIPQFFKSGQSGDILKFITSNQSIIDLILNSPGGSKWAPILTVGANIAAYSAQFLKDFFEMLQNEDFQTLAFAYYLEYSGIAPKPEEMYKTKAFQQLYTTKGYGGQPIVSGAYQRMTGRLPGIDVLPDSSTVTFEYDLNTLASKLEGAPESVVNEEVRKFLTDWSAKVSDFDRFVKENYPIIE